MIAEPRRRRPGAHRPGGGARRARSPTTSRSSPSARPSPRRPCARPSPPACATSARTRSRRPEAKIAALADLRAAGLRWHLVGHLQSNKAPPRGRALRRHPFRGRRHARQAPRARSGSGAPAAARAGAGGPRRGGDQVRPRRGAPLPDPRAAARLQGRARRGPDGAASLRARIPRRRGPTSAACASCATRRARQRPAARARAVDGHEPRLRGRDRRGRHPWCAWAPRSSESGRSRRLDACSSWETS